MEKFILSATEPSNKFSCSYDQYKKQVDKQIQDQMYYVQLCQFYRITNGDVITFEINNDLIHYAIYVQM